MDFPPDMLEAARALLTACSRGGTTVVTAESCTGGLIAACLTAVPGSSEVVERGLVTYSNQAKTELLGVPVPLLMEHGAVSEEVARAMARGALTHGPADLAVAVTGIAGPDGGSPSKPVGLVHLATAMRDGPEDHRRLVFTGDRAAIRRAAAVAAMDLALSLLEQVQGLGRKAGVPEGSP